MDRRRYGRVGFITVSAPNFGGFIISRIAYIHEPRQTRHFVNLREPTGVVHTNRLFGSTPIVRKG